MISTLYVIDRGNKMKIIIRKFVMVAMAITILFTNVNMVEASELKADNTSAYEQKTGMESRTTKTYSFGRSKSSYTIGIISKTSSSQFTIRMPNNNNKDLVQGTVYFIPMSGGTSVNYSYANYAREEYSLNLSGLSNGIYMVKIDGAAVGTSGSATIKVNY